MQLLVTAGFVVHIALHTQLRAAAGCFICRNCDCCFLAKDTFALFSPKTIQILIIACFLMSRSNSFAQWSSFIVLFCLLLLPTPCFNGAASAVRTKGGGFKSKSLATEQATASESAIQGPLEKKGKTERISKLQAEANTFDEIGKFCYRISVPFKRVFSLRTNQDCKKKCSTEFQNWRSYTLLVKHPTSRPARCVLSNLCLKKRSFRVDNFERATKFGTCSAGPQSSAQCTQAGPEPAAETSCTCYTQLVAFRLRQQTPNALDKLSRKGIDDPYKPILDETDAMKVTGTRYNCLPHNFIKGISGPWELDTNKHKVEIEKNIPCSVPQHDENECSCGSGGDESACRLTRLNPDSVPDLNEVSVEEEEEMQDYYTQQWGACGTETNGRPPLPYL